MAYSNNSRCLVDRVAKVRLKKIKFRTDIFIWKAIIPERDYELLKGSFTISFHGSRSMWFRKTHILLPVVLQPTDGVIFYN